MTDQNPLRSAGFEPWRKRVVPLAIALGIAFLVALALWFRAHFELATIPRGMDTMPRTHPPGASCLVLKRPRGVAVKDVLFVDLPEGGTLLARVDAVESAGFWVRASNEKSVLMGGGRRGPLALSTVRGRVVTVFGGEPDPDAK